MGSAERARCAHFRRVSAFSGTNPGPLLALVPASVLPISLAGSLRALAAHQPLPPLEDSLALRAFSCTASVTTWKVAKKADVHDAMHMLLL